MEAKNFLLLSRSEAVSRGLKHYFTGKPCLNGHISQRLASSCSCVQCSTEKQRSESLRAYKRSYYQKNAEIIRQRASERYQVNRKEKIAYAVDYRKRNLPKVLARLKTWRKSRFSEKPWLILHARLKSGLSHALRNVNSVKKNTTTNAIGCSFEELKIHIEKQFVKGMSWENRKLWHIDHIVPISKAKTEKEVLDLYHFTNLRPMWASENIKKSNKDLFLI